MRDMRYEIREAREEDAGAVMRVFNHYVENSFAAYPETKVPDTYFAALKEGSAYPVYVVENDEGDVVGFGMLRRHQRADAFDGTVEIGYFILPEHTGKGVGKALLAKLESEARDMGIRVLLANLSSRNEGSLRFHRANGFRECGRFLLVGRKFGRDFDVIWMQKFL